MVQTENYLGPARLPAAFARAGVACGALTFSGSHLLTTRHLAWHALWDGTGDRFSIAPPALMRAVEVWQPELIMPLDDRALHWLQLAAATDPPLACATQLGTALGDPTTYAWRIAKGPCRAAAASLGVRLPAGAAVENLPRALALAEQLTWPVVLKANLGTAGHGVAICRDADALRAAWPRIGNHPSGASLEQAIPGVPAMMVVAVWDGTVLAGMAARKERCSLDGIGPSSVIRFIEHADMAEVARRLCARFAGRGLISFDFILDADGRAWFLECNHRPVPIHHLGHLAAQDPVAALAAALRGAPQPAPGTACTMPISLFPQERLRDPSSQFLFPPAIEDVPVEDPGLLDRYRQLLAR